MAVSASPSQRRQQTPPTNRSCLLSPESIRFHSPYDYVKRARSTTPVGSPRPAIRDPGPVRRRLRQYETFDDVVQLLKSAQNVVILAGAGISTSVGIPDFRSKDGLYNAVNHKKRFANPQELFTKATFCDAPLDFYSDVMPIIPRLRDPQEGGRIAKPEDIVEFVPRFGATHAFFKLLDGKNKLRTVYTQNIDGLERAAGTEASHIVNCHGSWDSATCMTCRGKVSADEYLPVVYQGVLPLCMCSKPIDREVPVGCDRIMRERPKRAEQHIEYLRPSKPKLRKSGSTPMLKKRKRACDDETEDPQSRPGLLKPDITFFDEGISKAYEPRLLHDATRVDLFLIVGTSLPVEPVNKLPFEIPASVPQIWISREHCQRAGLKVDVELLGDCDMIVEELCRRAGWAAGLENRLWRNKFGSRLQAKEQLGKLRNDEMSTDESRKGQLDQTAGTTITSSGPPPGKVIKMEPCSALVGTKATSHHINDHAVTMNDLPLRPAPELCTIEHVQKAVSSPSPAKSKPLPDSKVKVESDLGADWKWYIRARR